MFFNLFFIAYAIYSCVSFCILFGAYSVYCIDMRWSFSCLQKPITIATTDINPYLNWIFCNEIKFLNFQLNVCNLINVCYSMCIHICKCTLSKQSVSITTKVFSSNTANGEVYSIHNYVINLVSDLSKSVVFS
jgi:hypothetical protein